MLREGGGGKYQTRAKAEEADHASHQAKQKRLAKRRQANYEKKALVSELTGVFPWCLAGRLHLHAGGDLPPAFLQHRRPDEAHEGAQGADEEAAGLHL